MEIRIPVGHIRLIGVAGAGSIRSGQRRERETTLPVDDSVPLPAADQLLDEAGGIVPELQLVTEVSVELMREAIGRDSAVQLPMIRAEDIRRFVACRRRQNSGIQ